MKRCNLFALCVSSMILALGVAVLSGCDGEKENLDKAYFIFSEDTYQVLMKDEKENFENLLSRLQFVKEINYESKRLNENVKIYKPKEDVFYREND